MTRAHLLALAGLVCMPATALAQAAPTHWSVVWGGPIFLAGALLLLGIGSLLAAPGWNRVGIVLWMLLATTGGCLAIYAMQGAALALQKWQLPAFCAAFLVFVVVGDWALRKLKQA